MAEFWETIWRGLLVLFNSFRIWDVLDIAIVAFLIYEVIKLVRETRAEQLVKGIVIFLICAGVAQYFNLRVFGVIMDKVFDIGVIAIIVLFQPELRRALEQVGRTRISRIGILNNNRTSEETNQLIQKAISAVCDSAAVLQRQRMGALIVFERESRLGEYVKTGTRIDALPTTELICNIFFNKAPLHDGAMIIRNGVVHAAACILPLSQNLEISSELGTRHRAALGLSELTDALVVVVSEETGAISLAQNGRLRRSLSVESLRSALETGLMKEPTASVPERQPFWKGRSK